MRTGSKKPHAERTHTDISLRAERDKADQHLEGRDATVERDADRVVEEARKKADCLVVEARQVADALPTAALRPAEDAGDLTAARLVEDDAVIQARAAADAKLETQRAEQQEAVAALLALEREETDFGLLRERERSDDAVASRDDFLAIVSHDVRGLLSGLTMSADLLLKLPAEGASGPRIHAAAERIRRLSGRMNRLVGDLLDVVGMESGKLSVTPVAQDARPLLAETIDGFQLAAAAQKIAISAEAPDHPVPAIFDHERILQVLTNIVGNAMKFTPAGGRVDLQLAVTPENIRFSVRDTGCGIPASKLATIFERFAQVAPTDRRGLGLGLYISRCIVEAHGGSIWAESDEGQGCVVHFTLSSRLSDSVTVTISPPASVGPGGKSRRTP
jgi:signal transduction histidine kinase